MIMTLMHNIQGKLLKKEGRDKGMKKKKLLLFFIDILTAVLLVIQIQSTVCMIIKKFSYLQGYQLRDFLDLYIFYGIAGAIYNSPYQDIYPKIQFIVFCLNIYAIVVKLKNIRNKELIRGIYRYFIIFNAVFVVFKIFEFYAYLEGLMSV